MPDRSLLAALRRWWGADPGTFTRRDGWYALAGLVVFALAFSAAMFAVERALGDPILTGRLPGGSKSLGDALWHLFTGFLVAIPMRRRLMLLVGPLLALGIDADHIFGTVLPTVVDREAHNLLFLVALGVILAVVRNRSAAAAAVGFATLHIGVDGGAFPLLAPFTTATWGLPYPVAAALIAGAALLAFAAVRPVSELRRPSIGIPWVVAVAVLVLLVPVVPGGILTSGASGPYGY